MNIKNKYLIIKSESNFPEVPFQDSKYPMYSSFLFLIPSLYSLYYKEYFYSYLLLSNTIISINYWKKCKKGFWRTLDLYSSKISFIIFLHLSLSNIIKFKYIINIILRLLNIFFFYNNSNILFYNNNSLWKYNHIIFHFFVSIEVYLTLQKYIIIKYS